MFTKGFPFLWSGSGSLVGTLPLTNQYCYANLECNPCQAHLANCLMLIHRLRETRERKGLSQKQLALLCGLGINQISRYENGATDPASHILQKLATSLGVSADYLLGLTDEPIGIAAPSE